MLGLQGFDLENLDMDNMTTPSMWPMLAGSCMSVPVIGAVLTAASYFVFVICYFLSVVNLSQAFSYLFGYFENTLAFCLALGYVRFCSSLILGQIASTSNRHQSQHPAAKASPKQPTPFPTTRTRTPSAQRRCRGEDDAMLMQG